MSKRSTVYHPQYTPEKWENVNYKNKELIKDFKMYLSAVDKSPKTIHQYESQLKIFFIYVLDHCENKFFVDLKKRDLIRYFGYLSNELNESPNRVASLRSVLSSLSNFIERTMDDEYPTFKNIVKILEPITKTLVRDKTVLSTEQIDDCLEKLVECGKYQVACLLAILASSGMRKAEVVQMKVEYFTESHLIFDGMAYETDKIRTKGRGKLGKVISRIVFVDPFVKYFDLWMKERERLGIKSEWLFVRYYNGDYVPATTTTATSWGHTISKYMGEEVYLHALRHYETTKLLRQGYPATVVQKLIRWESADMVSRYDDRSTNEELDEFMKSIQNK